MTWDVIRPEFRELKTNDGKWYWELWIDGEIVAQSHGYGYPYRTLHDFIAWMQSESFAEVPVSRIVPI